MVLFGDKKVVSSRMIYCLKVSCSAKLIRVSFTNGTCRSTLAGNRFLVSASVVLKLLFVVLSSSIKVSTDCLGF